MPAIKITGRKTSTASKTTGRKTALRNSRTSAPKAEPKKSAPNRSARSTAASKPKPGTGTKMSDGRVRRATTDDQKVIQKYIKLMTKAGAERDELFNAHREAVEAVYQVTREAMDAGVPTGVITEHTGISRQWLYKMGEHAGRDNGSTSKPKRGPGRPPKNSTATARKSNASGSKKPRIRTR